MIDRDEAIRARCEDCGLEYPFPDYVLPDDVWKRIAPNPDGNGLLCPTCIAKRLDKLGLWYDGGYFRPASLAAMTAERDALSERVSYECAAKNAFDIRWRVENAKYNKSIVRLQRARRQRDTLESALAEAQRRAEAAERDMNRCCPCEVCNKSCKYDKTNAYDECADFEWRGPEGERAPSKEDKP